MACIAANYGSRTVLRLVPPSLRISPSPDASQPSDLTAMNGTLFFSADDGPHGLELWKSDGTAVGTTLVKDIAHQRDAFPSISRHWAIRCSLQPTMACMAGNYG